MFKEKYKKDNEQIMASDELIAKTKERMISVSERKNRPILKTAVALTTTAAVICLCVLGYFSLNSGIDVEAPEQTAVSNNMFTLTAYAAEQQPDGEITKKQLEFNQTDMDSENPTFGSLMVLREDGDEFSLSLSTNIFLKCEGTNIENVLFSVDEGYFSKLDLDKGGPMQRIGTSYMITEQDLEDEDSLIFWSFDIVDKKTFDRREDYLAAVIEEGRTKIILGEITITAVVTFTDGEVQEKTVIYDTQKGTLIINEI